MNGCFPSFEREKVVLNAATCGAGPQPVIKTLISDPITVVSVTLDADRLSNPSILLTFTGIVNLPLGISVTLNFEILRTKDNGAPINVGSTYTFATTVNVLKPNPSPSSSSIPTSIPARTHTRSSFRPTRSSTSPRA